MTRLRIKQIQLKRQLVSQKKKARLEKIIYNRAQIKRQNKYKGKFRRYKQQNEKVQYSPNRDSRKEQTQYSKKQWLISHMNSHTKEISIKNMKTSFKGM